MSEIKTASNEPMDMDVVEVRSMPKTFTPSPQQQAAFDWIDNNPGSLCVIARAGSGKSTFLVNLVKRLKGKVFLGAFNKSIATELQERIGFIPNVEASTMHSLGFKLCRNLFNLKPELDSRKVRGLAKKLVPWDRKYTDALTQIVGYGKQAGFGIKGCPSFVDKEAWEQLIDHYDIWDEVPGSITPERLVKDVTKIYQQSLTLCQTEARIDFDDMILAPLVFGQPMPMYDWFLGDEWQDASLMRRMLVQFVLKPGGRVCLVGDPQQSVYSFAGAAPDSIEQSIKAFNCDQLPLSVTYRCPKAVVAKAQTWVPDITAHESAPEGTITQISYKALWDQEFSSKDVILCRNTRPLIGIAQRLRRNNIPCVVEGNNGQAIVALVTKWGEIDLGELRRNLDQYLTEQKAKWTAKDRLDKVEAVEERVGEVLDIAGGMDDTEPVRKLVSRVESLFGQGEDTRDVLRLCTGHRAKGREWDRVFWIGPEYYHPSKWAKQEWEKQSEANLEYVIVTRAKKELVEVEVAPPVKGPFGPVEWWER